MCELESDSMAYFPRISMESIYDVAKVSDLCGDVKTGGSILWDVHHPSFVTYANGHSERVIQNTWLLIYHDFLLYYPTKRTSVLYSFNRNSSRYLLCYCLLKQSTRSALKSPVDEFNSLRLSFSWLEWIS